MSLFKQRAEALRSQIHTQGSVVVNTPAQKEAFSTTSKAYNHHYICGWRCRGRLDLSQSIFEYKKQNILIRILILRR